LVAAAARLAAEAVVVVVVGLAVRLPALML
jgi:hypothetical protein